MSLRVKSLVREQRILVGSYKFHLNIMMLITNKNALIDNLKYSFGIHYSIENW